MKVVWEAMGRITLMTNDVVYLIRFHPNQQYSAVELNLPRVYSVLFLEGVLNAEMLEALCLFYCM